MGPLTQVATDSFKAGVGSAVVAYVATNNVRPEAAFTYAFSASILNSLARELGTELFAQTSIGNTANAEESTKAV